ncbi:hypothetical protein LguiA_029123 [Lonicera macranthoides]
MSLVIPKNDRSMTFTVKKASSPAKLLHHWRHSPANLDSKHSLLAKLGLLAKNQLRRLVSKDQKTSYAD